MGLLGLKKNLNTVGSFRKDSSPATGGLLANIKGLELTHAQNGEYKN